MKYYLLLIIFTTQLAYGQNYSCDTLFNRFKKDIETELTRYHQISWDDETRMSYYTIMLNCPIENLIKYTDDSIPAIRCTIFAGMAQKNTDINILSNILLKHKNDTAKYTDGMTDRTIELPVNFYMQMIVDGKVENKTPNEGGNYEFRLESLKNELRIIIPEAYHGIISKDALLEVDSLRCSWEGHKVISFTLYNNNESINTNNIFNDSVKAFIKSAKVGETLFIDDIRIEFPDKSRRQVGPIRLQLH